METRDKKTKSPHQHPSKRKFLNLETQCKSSGGLKCGFPVPNFGYVGPRHRPLNKKAQWPAIVGIETSSVSWCALERTLLFINFLLCALIKIPTHMHKQLQINLFSYFNLARNLKDQFSFSCSRWRAWVRLPVVNAHSLDFNLMCFRRCSIRMKLVILISHLFHRYKFINQFLQGINVHWVVIFQFVVMKPWSTTVFGDISRSWSANVLQNSKN